jgi:hypothetical protein
MSDETSLSKRTLVIHFAGAGMYGEARYELHGLSADSTTLSLPQLYDKLKSEGGVSEQTVNQYREQIDALPTATIRGGCRPAVVLQVQIMSTLVSSSLRRRR